MDAQETTASRHDDLHPNLAVLFGAGSAVALISAMSLPWPLALASTILGALMIAGAEVDARTYLLPDTVTWSAIALGILAVSALNPFEPWLNAGLAVARGTWTAAALAVLRWGYAQIRGREGLGLGDVKLAAAVGAWLPLEAIPLCFGLAAGAALVAVLLARLRGEAISGSTKIPFGAFLCPALWLIFYVSVLNG